MSNFDFDVEPNWPEAGKAASRVVLNVIYKPTGSVTPIEDLGPAELRSLVRAAVRGLAFTKVKRPWGQWKTTWDARVDIKVAPILALIDSLLPVAGVRRRVRRAA